MDLENIISTIPSDWRDALWDGESLMVGPNVRIREQLEMQKNSPFGWRNISSTDAIKLTARLFFSMDWTCRDPLVTGEINKLIEGCWTFSKWAPTPEHGESLQTALKICRSGKGIVYPLNNDIFVQSWEGEIMGFDYAQPGKILGFALRASKKVRLLPATILRRFGDTTDPRHSFLEPLHLPAQTVFHASSSHEKSHLS